MSTFSLAAVHKIGIPNAADLLVREEVLACLWEGMSGVNPSLWIAGPLHAKVALVDLQITGLLLIWLMVSIVDFYGSPSMMDGRGGYTGTYLRIQGGWDTNGSGTMLEGVLPG